MSADTGYTKLQKLMADFSSSYIKPMWEAKKVGSSLSRETDDCFFSIFRGYSEISATLDALAVAGKLIGIAPPRSGSIRKDEYLKFIVGAYLQEIYILEQRLTAYAKKIAKLYKRPELPSIVKKIVYEPMEGIINTRGSHVHVTRYSDERLNMLSMLALFQSVGEELGENLEAEYKSNQIEWKRRVKNNSKDIRAIVDRYCNELLFVICVDGKIVFPARSSVADVPHEFLPVSGPIDTAPARAPGAVKGDITVPPLLPIPDGKQMDKE